MYFWISIIKKLKTPGWKLKVYKLLKNRETNSLLLTFQEHYLYNVRFQTSLLSPSVWKANVIVMKVKAPGNIILSQV